MATVGKQELVGRGVGHLENADKSITAGEYREAELEIAMANAYARLADALGETKRAAVGARRAVGNW